VSKLIAAIFSFVVAVSALPVTHSITQPMIRQIAMSAPGEPDLSFPQTLNRYGFGLAIIAFVSGIIFSIRCIAGLPRSRGSLAAFITALVLASIPAASVFNSGPTNAPGDGGPNFMPFVVLIGGCLIGLPFLIWSLILLGPDRPQQPP